jgi:DNA-binding NarL/FixJ family response regulator
MERIGVFVADWQLLFREGIHFMLSSESNFDIVGEATTNEEAAIFIPKYQPDVAILNLDRDGLKFARRIKRDFPKIGVILLMDQYDTNNLFWAMKSGANACLSKDVDPDVLTETVKAVAAGDYPISQALLNQRIAALAVDQFTVFSLINGGGLSLLPTLSPLESKVLDRVLCDEIASTVGQTLTYALYMILAKLVPEYCGDSVIRAVQNRLVAGTLDNQAPA